MGNVLEESIAIMVDPILGQVHHASCAIKGEREGLLWQTEVLLLMDDFRVSFNLSVCMGVNLLTLMSLLLKPYFKPVTYISMHKSLLSWVFIMLWWVLKILWWVFGAMTWVSKHGHGFWEYYHEIAKMLAWVEKL